jgi:hypothetical protein
MAIPIKSQARVNHDGFVSIVILKDGSIYGIDNKYNMMELSRSYAGGCIREAMKNKLTAYHDMMEVANLTEKMGELVDARTQRKYIAPTLKKEHDAIAKLFKAFKAFKVENDTHFERLEVFEEKQEVAKKKKSKSSKADELLQEMNKPKRFRKEM